MFKLSLLAVSLVLVAGQTDLAPGEIEAPPTPVIKDFCSLHRDCNPLTKTRVSGANCVSGECVCTDSYELIPNPGNKPIGCRQIPGDGETPTPIEEILTNINMEFIWNFLCDQLADTFDTQAAAIGRRMARKCGARETDFIFRKKCGSVHAAYNIVNVPILTAASLDATQLLEESVAEGASEAPTFVQLGTPVVTDITAGTSTCPVVFPAIEAHFVGGSCHPTQCAPGYVLTTYDSANLIDTCDEIITTAAPSTSSSSDELSTGAIAGIVAGAVILLVLLIAVIYLLYQRCNKTNENYESRSQQNYTTDSDESDIYNVRNGPDESSAGAMDEESSYFDVGI